MQHTHGGSKHPRSRCLVGNDEEGDAESASQILRRADMTIGTILLVILILLLIGAIPSWPYSRQWGFGPSGGLGVILVVVVVLLFMGRI